MNGNRGDDGACDRESEEGMTERVEDGKGGEEGITGRGDDE